jgi:hypothetical protein
LRLLYRTDLSFISDILIVQKLKFTYFYSLSHCIKMSVKARVLLYQATVAYKKLSCVSNFPSDLLKKYFSARLFCWIEGVFSCVKDGKHKERKLYHTVRKFRQDWILKILSFETKLVKRRWRRRLFMKKRSIHQLDFNGLYVTSLTDVDDKKETDDLLRH